MTGQLLQFLGSLAAILVLAAIARWLKLGPSPRLASEDEARTASQEAADGFHPTHIGLDKEGSGALLANAAGEVLLLRPHGTHFAGRILTPAARVRLEDGGLAIDTAERRFGTAHLAIDNPQAWVQRIEAIR
ncbi:hypothetical protein [Erythrobacter sp. SD-21]|uniref:hypothetical protein n=1 Tax=Erythrobacter sp. SD-21 TaxID=161528 RepID=UPI000153F68A|nr:hypothetical protein [Erythrobacter sp. SD-21]EDL49034.1 hypothetical protein ED21_20179 [Erythrobacter sp. SD-21]